MKSIWDIRSYIAIYASMGTACIGAERIFFGACAELAFPRVERCDEHVR